MFNLMINDVNEGTDLVNNTATPRKLRLFRAGSRHFGIFEDQIATIAQWREPAPLPHAPESIMGVLGIQGRMLTVLDVARMVPGEIGAQSLQDNQHRQVIALRGDEQLALAVDELGETIEVPNHILDSKSDKDGLVLAVFKHAETEISIIDVNQLFPTAIQGRERRRRRF